MDNLKKLIFFSFFIVLLLLLFQNTQDKPEIERTPFIEKCENFDGRGFLLTGGSKIIQTNEDLIRENSRMSYLCRTR